MKTRQPEPDPYCPICGWTGTTTRNETAPIYCSEGDGSPRMTTFEITSCAGCGTVLSVQTDLIISAGAQP